MSKVTGPRRTAFTVLVWITLVASQLSCIAAEEPDKTAGDENRPANEGKARLVSKPQSSTRSKHAAGA